jgi:metal-responsive CopG/Arc/MetJ family transcriptional regulator
MRMNKDRISIALSKPLIKRLDERCRRVNRNRSNYIETILNEDLAKQNENEEPQKPSEIAVKLG